ncbi:MAG: LON peptidase substrate-binding domain-containing protein [Deltaproteobacteria bacterium]|nr:LON peptidase substrate-binding domain-containing protein [Deltaproteobacteria bacterium]
MDRTEIARTCETLRVFPLPGTVLMPGAPLPLHVFEPRYRQLVADALEGDGILCVPQIAEGQEEGHLGRPELLPYVAVGRIALHHQLPDGRYNILVQPIGRARLRHELPAETPYRRFVADFLDDTDDDDARTALIGRRVVGLVAPVLAMVGADADKLQQALSSMEPSRVPQSLAPLVLREAAERQAYIAEDSAVKRAVMVEHAVLTYIAETRGAAAEA